jgi:carbon storage regulator
MLIITRRRGEVLCIGEDIQIVIVNVDGMQVRLGITAPQEVSVDRQEIRDAKTRAAGGSRDV